MKLLFIYVSLLLQTIVFAQGFSIYEKRYYNAPELNMPYRYMRPLNAEPDKKYPLIIFLHGAMEKGFDNESPLYKGGQFFMRDSIRKKYSAYVMFPQCPAADLWASFETKENISTHSLEAIFSFTKKPTEVSAVLMRLIDSLLKADKIDPARIYIGGWSQGAMGVLDLIARYPDSFAAGFAMAGAGDVSTAKRFAGKTALWLFHGELDDIVPAFFSRSYAQKLKKLKADFRYSEYPGVKHSAIVNAFQEPELMSWLFSKKK